MKKGRTAWNKGKTGIYSKETLEKNRIAHFGKKQSQETINKRIEKLKGHITSEETKRKIGLANKGKIRSEESKRNLSLINKGNKYVLGKHWKLSEQAKKNISNGHKGLPGGMLGKKQSKEAIAKIIAKTSGKNHWFWKGGISKDNEYRKEYGKNYRKKNYNRILYINLRRKVMKLGNGGSHTYQEWETLKAQYNFTCPCCHKSEPEIKLTEDHIIPLSKGGSDNIENIQPLCKSCNCKKHTKTIKYES